MFPWCMRFHMLGEIFHIHVGDFPCLGNRVQAWDSCSMRESWQPCNIHACLYCLCYNYTFAIPKPSQNNLSASFFFFTIAIMHANALLIGMWRWNIFQELKVFQVIGGGVAYIQTEIKVVGTSNHPSAVQNLPPEAECETYVTSSQAFFQCDQSR